MPQLVTRIDDETAAAIDALVDEGEFASRSDVVRAGILRLVDDRRRRAIGGQIIAGYERALRATGSATPSPHSPTAEPEGPQSPCSIPFPPASRKSVYGMRMARVNVYLPDNLAAEAKRARLNVSAITQDAIRSTLAVSATDTWLAELEQLDRTMIEHNTAVRAVAETKDELWGDG